MAKEKLGWQEKTERLAVWTVSIIGIMIFLFLTWYAFQYTHYMLPGAEEKALVIMDSKKQNLLALLLAIVGTSVLIWLEKKLSKLQQHWVSCAAIAASLLFVGGMTLLWLRSEIRQPIGDQAFIYGGASYFMEGNYNFLSNGGYCTIYPHQLGLIAFVEMFFHIVGAGNFLAFQYLNGCFAIVTVFTGYCVVSRISKRMSVHVLYSIFMMGCMPLYLYSYWVYGDVGSVFFCMLTFYFLLRYHQEGKGWQLAGMALAITAAILFRKNSLIFLIALVLICGIHILRTRDKKLLLGIILCCAIPFLSYQAVYKMYELRSGYPHMSGIPTNTWIAMGMQNELGQNGWYNNYPKTIFYENDMGIEATKQVAAQEIRDHLAYFRQNPGYAWEFYREKILSQWNEPLYQSLYFSYETMGHQLGNYEELRSGTMAETLTETSYSKVLNWNDRVQFLIFVGMFCFFAFSWKHSLDRKGTILEYMLAVAVIGGFFFSILWEAKARYIMPYYVVMFPYAAIGYQRMIDTLQGLLPIGRKHSKVVDIEDYRNVA